MPKHNYRTKLKNAFFLMFMTLGFSGAMFSLYKINEDVNKFSEDYKSKYERSKQLLENHEKKLRDEATTKGTK